MEGLCPGSRVGLVCLVLTRRLVPDPYVLQYLNIKLENTRVVDEQRFPHLKSVRNCFVRGSVVRYVQLPTDGVDVDILHDATRREARGSA